MSRDKRITFREKNFRKKIYHILVRGQFVIIVLHTETYRALYLKKEMPFLKSYDRKTFWGVEIRIISTKYQHKVYMGA